MPADALQRARDAYEHRQWSKAYELLTAMDQETPISAGELEALATTAALTGRDDESLDVWTRAHNAHAANGDIEGAARCAFWLGFRLLYRGEMARGGGWLARAELMLDEANLDCVARGYLLIPAALELIERGEFDQAIETFLRAGRVAEQFGDAGLAAMSRLGRGRSLLQIGRVNEGLALLDQVMVDVTAGEVGEIIVGIVYCAVIEGCREIFDVGRAQEWTATLARWCAAQPDLVPYRGQCRVHRAEIMQVHGEWSDALDEVHRARVSLAGPPRVPAIGEAFYRAAEIHRLRGELAEAEVNFRESNDEGRNPQPGLALMRLAQGQTEAAAASIRLAVEGARSIVERAAVIPAYVEIMIAADDIKAARMAADDLDAIAADVGTPYVKAMSAKATGQVLLAEGEPRTAIVALREAWKTWQEIGAPYEAARVRELIATAGTLLGDGDTAAMDLDAARRTYEQLGATVDLKRIGSPAPRASILTPREVEVLRLVATGKTNRAIAGVLVLSEKTVARHVSNIFTKLGLASRTEATAYAYENDLL